MQTTTVNDIRMAYRDEGGGEPLLLVHAFPLNSAMWERQIAALAGARRVIAPDLRGFGATELGDAEVGMDQYADDLAALLDQLGLERVALAGLSMGGYISFAFLRRHRDRVAGLVLADTRAQPDTEEGRQGRYKNAQLAEEQGPGAIADQLLPKLLAPSAPQALRDELRGIIEANDGRAIAAALRAMAARPDSTPLLSTIAVPTVIVVGAEDTLTPPEDSRRMRDAISGSRLTEIRGAGHMSNMEKPDAFNAAVESLWERQSQRGAGSKSGGTW